MREQTGFRGMYVEKEVAEEIHMTRRLPWEDIEKEKKMKGYFKALSWNVILKIIIGGPSVDETWKETKEKTFEMKPRMCKRVQSNIVLNYDWEEFLQTDITRASGIKGYKTLGYAERDAEQMTKITFPTDYVETISMDEKNKCGNR